MLSIIIIIIHAFIMRAHSVVVLNQRRWQSLGRQQLHEVFCPSRGKLRHRWSKMFTLLLTIAFKHERTECNFYNFLCKMYIQKKIWPILRVRSVGAGVWEEEWERSRFWGFRSLCTMPRLWNTFSADAEHHNHLTTDFKQFHLLNIQLSTAFH